MSEKRRARACHTEHEIWECWVGPTNASEVRLFRSPTVLDGSGTHYRLPHEITWTDAQKGDLILAILIDERGSIPSSVFVLQFWHVLEIEDDSLLVEVNNLVGSAADGEYIYDRFAGLLGLPPGTYGEHK